MASLAVERRLWSAWVSVVVAHGHTCGQSLKSLWNLLQYCFCFTFCFGLVFWLQSIWALRSQQWSLCPIGGELRVLTIGPPGKSQITSFWNQTNLDENPSSSPCSLWPNPLTFPALSSSSLKCETRSVTCNSLQPHGL